MAGLLKAIAVVCSFAALAICWYQETKFASEWLEEHPEMPWTTRARLHVRAIFSRSLSERCRNRRRKVIISWLLFGITIALVGLISTTSNLPVD
jgi:hypothetical protein